MQMGIFCLNRQYNKYDAFSLGQRLHVALHCATSLKMLKYCHTSFDDFVYLQLIQPWVTWLFNSQFSHVDLDTALADADVITVYVASKSLL